MSHEQPAGGWKFLRDHDSEVRPLLEAPERKKLDCVEEAPHSSESAPYVKELLEKFETKIFSFKNENAAPGAKRILVEASFTAAFKVMSALIEKMRGDSSVSEIVLLTDNLAGKYFSEQKESHSPREIIRGDGTSMLEDVLRMGPFDVAFAMEDALNSPVSILLYGAKSVFGTKRLYYFLPGFIGETTKIYFASVERKNADEIDTIIVGDELAGRLASAALNFPLEKIVVAGSPLLDALAEDGGEHKRGEGRRKAGIPESANVVLFLGDKSEDYRALGGDPDANIKTFQETLRAVIEAAQKQPEKDFACIIRPHPKAPDEHLLSFVKDVPQNLKFFDGSGISYDEAVYAADIVCCPVTSTEGFVARYRGRAAALLAYEGLGWDIARQIYGKQGIEILANSGAVSVLSSGGDLVEQLAHIDPLSPRTMLPHAENSAEKIRDILLS